MICKCSNGHLYDSDYDSKCPYCENTTVEGSAEFPKKKRKKRIWYRIRSLFKRKPKWARDMSIVKCSEGHFYNLKTDKECPHCKHMADGQEESTTIERCCNGHFYYASESGAKCPYCGSEPVSEQQIRAELEYLGDNPDLEELDAYYYTGDETDGTERTNDDKPTDNKAP